MVKPKDQGTTEERRIISLAEAHGCKAWRLAPAGTNDIADIVLQTPDGDHYILQVKSRQQLNIHKELGKLEERLRGADLPWAVAGYGVAWKRLVRREGAKRRVQAGPSGVFVPLREWLELIKR